MRRRRCLIRISNDVRWLAMSIDDLIRQALKLAALARRFPTERDGLKQPETPKKRRIKEDGQDV